MSDQLPEDDGPDFVSIIREAVTADPQNLGLRVDLVELLLESQPEVAAVEIETLSHYGANQQTVMVLRARAAAALLRRRNASPGADAGGGAVPTPDAPPAAPAHPTAPPPSSTPEAPSGAPAAEGPPALGGPSAAEDPRARIGGAVPGAEEQPVWDVERPTIRLADVAGMAEVKQHLDASFLAPMRNPELARMFGKQPRGSLLMYGPPGCGKTFIARAIAGELGASFVHATLADIMGEYRGQAEKAIQQLFTTARAARPCVIFFDEFDAIGGRRTSGNSFAQGLRMITSQLLEEFDGVDASNDGVYVLAATNRPWDIDTALRRPGRLDRTVLILPPDAPAREAIVQTGLRDKPAAAIDAASIAQRTEEFSGADLSYVVETAIEQAFMESLQSGVPRMIRTYDLEAAASRIVPSTRSWFEQIKPVLEYGVDDGTFSQLRTYLKKHRI
ncbi:ATP-binding protein [Microbacterium sp. P02]|uniref:ATP-binding protein n=1 Tax=Microbacterium sp. P02 TaxID=3366260 RepID=UPI00366E8763